MVPWLRRALSAAIVGVLAFIAPLTMPAQAAFSAAPARNAGAPADPRPDLTGAVTAPTAQPVDTSADAAGDTCKVAFNPKLEAVSNCWSGFLVPRDNVTSISATWVVPGEFTSSSDAQALTAIGIDGVVGSDPTTPLLQAGTAMKTDPRTGVPMYYAWWEAGPATAVQPFALTIKPGDAVYVAMTETSVTATGGEWSIVVTDLNTNLTATTTQGYSGPGATAEFLQERPTINSKLVPLAHFTAVTFLNARVNTQSPRFTTHNAIFLLDVNNPFAADLVSTTSKPNQAGNGFTVANITSVPPEPADPVVLLGSNDSVTASFGGGFVLLDNNPLTMQVAAGAGSVYQRRLDGSVWEWAGFGPCGEKTGCPNWVQLIGPNPTADIEAGEGTVFRRDLDNTVWRSTGIECDSPTSCPGWVKIDDGRPTNTNIFSIVVGAQSVYELRLGSIWRWTQIPCDGSTCTRGWAQINDDLTLALVAGQNDLFEGALFGRIARWPSGDCGSPQQCQPWTMLDSSGILFLAASDTLYEERSNGDILKFFGPACSNPSNCPGWLKLDNDLQTAALAASPGALYRLRNDGSVRSFTSIVCVLTCQWTQIAPPGTARAISVSNGS
jgi:hypothetical protein